VGLPAVRSETRYQALYSLIAQLRCAGTGVLHELFYRHYSDDKDGRPIEVPIQEVRRRLREMVDAGELAWAYTRVNHLNRLQLYLTPTAKFVAPDIAHAIGRPSRQEAIRAWAVGNLFLQLHKRGFRVGRSPHMAKALRRYLLQDGEDTDIGQAWLSHPTLPQDDLPLVYDLAVNDRELVLPVIDDPDLRVEDQLEAMPLQVEGQRPLRIVLWTFDDQVVLDGLTPQVITPRLMDWSRAITDLPGARVVSLDELDAEMPQQRGLVLRRGRR